MEKQTRLRTAVYELYDPCPRDQNSASVTLRLRPQEVGTALFALILRVYSYLYHLVLCLFLLGIAIVAKSSTTILQMPMLPWSGSELLSWLLWGSLAGLLSVILAVTGVFRFLFPIWALTVLILMVQGFILKPYTFEGKPDFYQVLWLIAGAALAFLGSLTLLRPKRNRRA